MAKPKKWVYFNCEACWKESYMSQNRYNKQKIHACCMECRNMLIWKNYTPWQKFWKLTVIERWECKWTRWRELFCKCDCWNITKIYATNRWHIKSCWCLWWKTTHWMTGTPEMNCRRSMQARCNNPNSISYPNYWWKQIKLWYKNFEEFYNDLWPRPWPEYSVDRIDNNKGYEPWNCRWATMKQQSNNRKNNVICIINWEEHTLQEWADKLWMNRKTLKRYILKWKIDWQLYNYKIDKRW